MKRMERKGPSGCFRWRHHSTSGNGGSCRRRRPNWGKTKTGVVAGSRRECGTIKGFPGRGEKEFDTLLQQGRDGADTCGHVVEELEVVAKVTKECADLIHVRRHGSVVEGSNVVGR